EAPMIDNGLQGAPLIEGHTGHFHLRFLQGLVRSGSVTLAVLSRRPPQMRRLSYMLFALLPLAAVAATYPVELEQQLNGAEINATPEAIDRDLAGLLLLNYGKTPAVCTAVFRN